MRFAFPCKIVRDEEEKMATGREAYNVTFPDVYGANTSGWSWEEALEMAEDCLAVALDMYVEGHEDLPAPSPLAEGQVLISLPPIAAASLAVYSAMRKQGITKAEMAEQLNLSEDAVGKLLDPRYRTHMSQIEKALEAVGRSLIIEDRAAPYLPAHPERSAAESKDPVTPPAKTP